MHRADLTLLSFFFIVVLYAPPGFAQESVPGDSVSLKNPNTALICSALFPGAGQYYAESYFHGTAFVALNGYLIYKIVSRNNEFYNIQSDLEKDPDNETLKNDLERVRDSRNLHIWLWSAAYILNLMDAYTEATLFNFDQRMDMKVGGDIIPNGGNPVPAVTLRMEF
jgi:hypothetical protein